MRALTCFFITLSLLSCNKKEFFEGPNAYSEDFSAYRDIEDLIEGDNQRWSFFQKTHEANSLTLDTLIYHSAGKSFRSAAVPTSDEGGVSKASINKQFMAFWEGETVVMEAWYYIAGTDSADWVFLFDLEEKVNIGAGPGMRLALVQNRLLVEHKYPNPHITQAAGQEIDFPRNQWVDIRMETLLSQKKEGYVQVWQDDQLILEQYNWQTLPKDILYFNLGTKGMYNQIEFGVTANSRDNPMTVYVDDIEVRIAN